MVLLGPEVALLDEVGSELSIGTLQEISKGVSALESEQKAITLEICYQLSLGSARPTFARAARNIKTMKTGDFSLVLELELKGREG